LEEKTIFTDLFLTIQDSIKLILFNLYDSLKSRLSLFLHTAFPDFLETATPTLTSGCCLSSTI